VFGEAYIFSYIVSNSHCAGRPLPGHQTFIIFYDHFARPEGRSQPPTSAARPARFPNPGTVERQYKVKAPVRLPAVLV
jgi:hypothetical protein